MYVDAITATYSEYAELVALCDLSQTRMDWYNRQLQTRAGLSARPTYRADQFDRMIEDTSPDVVIVATIDGTHHQYIVRAMELGRDVITEKPMTTRLEKMKAIFDAIERTGRSLRVTFNYRYAPAYTKLRELGRGLLPSLAP
jgi:predicted dehydrogenase